MELQVLNGSSVEVLEAVFAKDFNEGLVHQAVVTHMAGQRSGTKAQKSRSDVSGGGIKPWRQKGTGRARAGTIRSPLWRSGGVTFASSNRDYSKKINKKMYKAALQSIFSELVRSDALVIVGSIPSDAPNTKNMLAFLSEIGTNNVLLVTSEEKRNAYLSSRNIPHCELIEVRKINPVNLIAHEKVVIESAVIKKIEEWLS